MNTFVVLFATLALSVAAPSADRLSDVVANELPAIREPPVLDHEEVHDKYGQYAMRYVTAEGNVISERGRLVQNIAGDGYLLIIEGEITYFGDDGKVYVTKFTSGIDGTQAEGNQLPVALASVTPQAEVSESSKSLLGEAYSEALPAI